MSLDQLAGAAEYTNCISAEGEDYSNECPEYDTKQSDSEARGMRNTPVIAIAPRSTLVRSDSTW